MSYPCRILGGRFHGQMAPVVDSNRLQMYETVDLTKFDPNNIADIDKSIETDTQTYRLEAHFLPWNPTVNYFVWVPINWDDDQVNKVIAEQLASLWTKYITGENV